MRTALIAIGIATFAAFWIWFFTTAYWKDIKRWLGGISRRRPRLFTDD